MKKGKVFSWSESWCCFNSSPSHEFE